MITKVCLADLVGCDQTKNMSVQITKKHMDDAFGKRFLPGSFDYIDKFGYIARVSIKQTLFKNPATVVFWDDNTKTIAKCNTPDVFDAEKGLLLCTVKKIAPNTNIEEMFSNWCVSTEECKPGKTVVRTLKDVRKNFR